MKASVLVCILNRLIRRYSDAEVLIPPGHDTATGESICPLTGVLYHEETDSIRLEGDLHV